MNIQNSPTSFKSSNPRVLVTGATGYIGSVLSGELAKEGYDLVVCGRDPKKVEHLKKLLEKVNKEKANKGNHTFVNLELTNPEQIDRFLDENRNIDGVFHLGGMNSNARSIQNPQETYEANLVGSMNLLNSMMDKDIKRVLFVSTGSTYGQVKNISRIDEKVAQHPETPYAKSKAMVEQIIQDYKAYGLQSTILRLFNVAGAGSNEDLTIGANVVSIIMNRLKNGTEFVLNGNKLNTPDGTSVRDFVHVKDACGAMSASFGKMLRTEESGLYNVGSGAGTSLKEVIDLSEKASGRKLNLRVNECPQYEPPVLIVDNSKIKSEVGWRPQHSVSDIVEDAWRWCEVH